MNIVLIGYRGAGKSEVAKLLAKSLKMKSLGVDNEIVKKAGLSIPEIVEKYGWGRFRDMESEVTLQLSQLDNIILDTGGGVIERSENVETLRKNALIFWLQASVDTIVARIESGTERPALTEGKSFTEEVTEVLAQRSPKYAEAAHYKISTDDKDPAQVVAEIVEIWEKNSTCGVTQT